MLSRTALGLLKILKIYSMKNGFYFVMVVIQGSILFPSPATAYFGQAFVINFLS